MAFKNEDMPRFRREMKQELIDRRLSHGPSRTANSIKLERRISNFDGETCWLNSTLQMILCAMDHNPYHHMFSTLGMELQRAQTQGLIDPRYIFVSFNQDHIWTMAGLDLLLSWLDSLYFGAIHGQVWAILGLCLAKLTLKLARLLISSRLN